MLALLTLGLVGALAGCSSPDPGNMKPQTPTGDERDTAIKHEPCDISSQEANRVDVNGDNRPDIIHVMRGGREVCRVVDLNLDGSIDAFIYYDAQGLERRRESDFDRDGRADEITQLQGGFVVLKERETNFDNKIDTWDYYQGGRLVRRERDSDGDSIIDQWWEFNNPMDPRCAIVAADRNTDRKPDPDSVVDLCADQYGAPQGMQLPPPPGAAPPGAAPPPGYYPPGSMAPPGAAPPSAAPYPMAPQQPAPGWPTPGMPGAAPPTQGAPAPAPAPTFYPPPAGQGGPPR